MSKKKGTPKEMDELRKDVVETSENTESAVAVTEDTNKGKPKRRQNGQGSVWRLANGKYGWCIQLTADKELRAKYGNKLRQLGSETTYDLASRAALAAIDNREVLLKNKLATLDAAAIQ